MILPILLQAVSFLPAQPQPGTTAKLVLHLPGLVGASRAQIHYGFNGWNLPLNGAGAGQETVEGNVNYFSQRPLVRNAGGDFELTLAIPPQARALHFAVCRDACGSGQWDNNGGKDYSWPFKFPYVGPLLTWDETTAPAEGVVVSFFSSVSEAGWIRYGTGNGAAKELRDGGGERHVFALHGLAADTSYWYEVGGAAKSERYTFRTAKRDLKALSFAAISDAQDNGETGHFKKTVDELVQHHSDLNFLVVAGDMTWNDHPGDWWAYFDLARPLLASKVVMPAIGNHDTPTAESNPDHRSFEAWFHLPKTTGATGDFYRFDYGPARFFALDSERMLDFAAPNGSQLRWLNGALAARRAELAQATKPLWTFTYWHISPFDGGARHWAQQFDYRAPARGFPGVVDWDISGHEHLGQRFRPLQFDAAAPRAVDDYGLNAHEGTGFIVLPAAGAVPETGLIANDPRNGNVRDLMHFPAADEDSAAAFNGFERVDIDGGGIRLRMFGAAPSGGAFTVRDEVRYDK